MTRRAGCLNGLRTTQEQEGLASHTGAICSTKVRPVAVLRAFCSPAAKEARSSTASIASVRCRSWLCTKPCPVTPRSEALISQWDHNQTHDILAMRLSKQILYSDN